METSSYWTERRFNAMGSTAHLVVGDADERLIDWAVAEVERLEQCWSRFRVDSELSCCNARSGGWLEASPTLMLALCRARDLWYATAGTFDPTVLDALVRSGYDRSFEDIEPCGPPAAEPRPAPGFGAVELDVEGCAVRLPARTRLDLGGLGKGLAADMIAEGLVDRGARSAVAALGGDIRACGQTPEPDGWLIPVEDPFLPGRTRFEHRLVDGALVTSTRLLRTWRRGVRRHHHIVDPATGASADGGIAAVVVCGPEAWWSEGLAKAAMILGPGRAEALLAGAAVRGWIFLDDGSVSSVNAEVPPPCSPG